jgi:hypothetical protein
VTLPLHARGRARAATAAPHKPSSPCAAALLSIARTTLFQLKSRYSFEMKIGPLHVFDDTPVCVRGGQRAHSLAQYNTFIRLYLYQVNLRMMDGNTHTNDWVTRVTPGWSTLNPSRLLVYT